ncbi:hypothetical protein VW29_02265 [Devosia limi DSM 17137]|uniref:Uncharacterized protein n=1 Tax=Devosia limi DSM 17137 TaxID=1121477 RepID=A0A0F5LVK9_9HYPH|nr:hypothetical protein [Devosia limi]KKB86410.1 hypothetical protein VW29_02265 [Devosia limi DSM 17137]SHE89930.1 hypothetical protein SAMN02745223_01370 [Devosia limi DSM 17137]
MADYKELLRRAISALPENNGAARRAVYEKARSALVGQLRAITPPLPARDITQHRLQLEDCIRQVEQEASEAVISLGRDSGLSFRPPPPAPATAPPQPIVAETHAPEPVQAPEPPPIDTKPAGLILRPTPVAPPAAPVVPKPDPVTPVFVEPPASAPKTSISTIEDIISEAAATGSAELIKPALDDSETETLPVEHVVPSVVARAEATKSGPTSPLPANNVRPIETPLRAPVLEPRREAFPPAANSEAPMRSGARVEPSLGGQAAARQQIVDPVEVIAAEPVETALSAVREVEVEAVQADMTEAEGAIERAIETLDREARGEASEPLPDVPKPVDRPLFANAPKPATDLFDQEDASDPSFSAAPDTPRNGGGLTIFLIVFVMLLAGVGGAGFWAWREGYVDLDQMFGRSAPAVAQLPEAAPSALPTLDPTPPSPAPDAGPGNTAATANTTEPTSALEGMEIDDRLEPTPTAVAPNGTETVLPGLNTPDNKGEERLPDEQTAAVSPDDLSASVDPAVLAGSQSLLLEASADGRTGAVPFSGTIEWSEGVDELGTPTLVGRANIPARNLGVDLTIRKNADPSLPASHLMEVDFDVNDTFIGGTISALPGVLLKDAELVPGTPLVGASARVVGNSFLFALSASPTDAETNRDLLENRKWMDLAVIYGTGRNAIITLEKDEAAQALFDKVFAVWQ